MFCPCRGPGEDGTWRVEKAERGGGDQKGTRRITFPRSAVAWALAGEMGTLAALSTSDSASSARVSAFSDEREVCSSLRSWVLAGAGFHLHFPPGERWKEAGGGDKGTGVGGGRWTMDDGWDRRRRRRSRRGRVGHFPMGRGGSQPDGFGVFREGFFSWVDGGAPGCLSP